MSPKAHPEQMRRVTSESVRAVLDAAAVTHGRVFTFRPGVVRVEVSALSAGRRLKRQHAVAAALESQRFEEGWGIRPVGICYRWQPWVT
ncbi:hypothetical protein [Amycolatopsis nigrescens]|uniref:hypothetical protein n=1 Tax=Amycolatopsis nigrescens TaxID=381445 RepID=UPI0012FA1293|nr:hypothetical protein [Amycolatopsis nigrescens]